MAFPIDNDSASFSLFPKRTVLAFSRKSSVVSDSHRTFFCKVANRSQVGPKIGFYSKQSFTLFVNFAPGHGGAACKGSVKFIKNVINRCYLTSDNDYGLIFSIKALALAIITDSSS